MNNADLDAKPNYELGRRSDTPSFVRRSIYSLGSKMAWFGELGGTLLLVVLFFCLFSQHATAQTNPRILAVCALLSAMGSIYFLLLCFEFLAKLFLTGQRRKADKAFASNDLATARRTYEQCLRQYEKSGATNSSDIIHCIERLLEIHGRIEESMPTQLMDLQFQGWKQSLKLYESNHGQKQLSSSDIEQRRKGGLRLWLALPVFFGLMSIRIWLWKEPAIACVVMALGLLLSIGWWFELKRTLLRKS